MTIFFSPRPNTFAPPSNLFPPRRPRTGTNQWAIPLAMVGWVIALHGGAGAIPINLPDERRIPRETALRHCLDLGVPPSNPANIHLTSPNSSYASLSLSQSDRFVIRLSYSFVAIDEETDY
ncbi:hypothetical protein YC2023_013075 [Brassica napus]